MTSDTLGILHAWGQAIPCADPGAANSPVFGMEVAGSDAEASRFAENWREDSQVAQLSAEDRAEHWRRTRNLMIGHLVVWFIFSFGVHMFADQLYYVSFFGWPLSYYLAAQGSLIVFVVQLFLFNWQQNAIDVQFGVDEASNEIK